MNAPLVRISGRVCRLSLASLARPFDARLLPLIALLVIAITVFPWRAARPQTYSGFDRHLSFVSLRGGWPNPGSLNWSATGASFVAEPNSKPTLDLVTSENDFAVNFSARPLLDGVHSYPLVARFWYPSRGDFVDLRFDADKKALTMVSGSYLDADKALDVLGGYRVGATYLVHMVWHHGSALLVEVNGPDNLRSHFSVSRASGLPLFDEPFVDFAMASNAVLKNHAAAEVSGFSLSIPATTRFASMVDDQRLRLLTLLVLAWCAISFLVSRRKRFNSPSRLRLAPRAVLKGYSAAALVGGLAFVALVALVYWAAAHIDGHPFDRLSQESWMDVLQRFGLGSLYSRTSAIPDAAVRGNALIAAPWSPAEFAYPPGIAYFYWSVASLWGLLHGAIVPLKDPAFLVFWKSAFGVTLVGAGVLLMYVARALKLSWRWAAFIGGLFLLNPAVIFDSPGWGQSNSLVWIGLLFSAIGIIGQKSRLTWSGAILAAMMKQTGLLVLPVIAIFAIRRFGIRRSVESLSFALVAAFVFLSPLILSGYGPATFYASTVSKLLDFGSSFTHYATVVSADSFPVWVLLSGNRGLHGMQRLWSSDAVHIPGLPFSYGTGGVALFGVAMILVLVSCWRGSGARTNDNHRFLLAMAITYIVYVALTTRSSAHYMILGLPFLLLAAIPRSVLLACAAGVLSIIAFVSEYGLFMTFVVRGDWGNFALLGGPSTNGFSRVVYTLYSQDAWISTFAVLFVLIAMAVLAVLLKEVLGVRRNPASRWLEGRTAIGIKETAR